MTQISEIDIIKTIDEVLNSVEEPEAIVRILTWVNSKYGFILSQQPSQTPQSETITQKDRAGRTKSKSSSKTRSKVSLTQIKDLNTSPSGKTTLTDFINDKQPKSHVEKGTVVAYYLINTLEIKPSINHIFTCYKHVDWRLPSNLPNMLQQAGTKGWLDTSDNKNIIVTHQGQNLVEHDLPRQKK